MGRLWFLRDFLLIALAAAVLFVVLGQVVWLLTERRVPARTLVDIEEGMGLRTIALTLEEKGLLRDVDRFVISARVLGLERELQAGTYEFGPEFTQLEILTALKYGYVAGRLVTVPEGFRASQIAILLEDTAGVDASEFMDLARSEAFSEQLGVDAKSLEGYLHPETYSVNLDASTEDVVRMMVQETQRVFDIELKSRAATLGMTLHEVVTLASIIEAEVVVDAERKKISAVYHNRLEHGWRLEADPTVRYAQGNYRRKLFYKDLDVDSPYNTYRNTGLPPGPICSPGRASIVAALYPDESSRDFFFVSNGDGTHTFSRTFKQHLNAQKTKVVPEIGGGENLAPKEPSEAGPPGLEVPAGPHPAEDPAGEFSLDTDADG